jgi:hypothetical protein
LINLAAWTPGREGDLTDSVFDRHTRQSLPKHVVDIVRFFLIFAGWRHYDYEFAACLRTCGVFMRQCLYIAAFHFFMQFCQLTANGCFAISEGSAKLGEHGGHARSALEQHKSRWNIREYSNAFLACGLFGWQKTLEKETVGRQSRDR